MRSGKLSSNAYFLSMFSWSDIRSGFATFLPSGTVGLLAQIPCSIFPPTLCPGDTLWSYRVASVAQLNSFPRYLIRNGTTSSNTLYLEVNLSKSHLPLFIRFILNCSSNRILSSRDRLNSSSTSPGLARIRSVCCTGKTSRCDSGTGSGPGRARSRNEYL